MHKLLSLRDIFHSNKCISKDKELTVVFKRSLSFLTFVSKCQLVCTRVYKFTMTEDMLEKCIERMGQSKANQDGKHGNYPSSENRTLVCDLEWLPGSLTTSILFYELDLDRIARFSLGTTRKPARCELEKFDCSLARTQSDYLTISGRRGSKYCLTDLG